MTKQIKKKASTTKDVLKTAITNLSIFLLGTALVTCAYGNYQYAQTTDLPNVAYKLVVASTALIGGIGIYVLGKWLANKTVEIK